jgi:cytochrome bd-type quinol oxidase subunit 2
MARNAARAAYVFAAVVVCPLAAWSLAVGTANDGSGWREFLLVLFGLPIVGALLAAALLRRRRREAALGAAGAVAATFVLVVALVFVTLSSR